MNTPFIRNHQHNFIKKQVSLLQRAITSGADPRVIEAVKYSAVSKITESFTAVTEFQRQLLEQILILRTEENFQHYLHSLEPYLEEFSPVTVKQLNKLFPKIKKLKTPNLTAVDYRSISYLGWIDIALNKLFLVYHLNGKLVGIEGRYTPANKGICFLCNKVTDVALFSAVQKTKPVNASPDYYKAIGNYMCVDSKVCNKNITDLTALEKFFQEIAGNR